MLCYATLGTNDPHRAQMFYDTLLGTIGAHRLIDHPDHGYVMWGIDWNTPALAVTRPHDVGPASPGNGTMVALRMESRAGVDAFHAQALRLGGSDEGAPGLRGDEGEPAFYAAYFRDPDGNKLCAFRVGPA